MLETYRKKENENNSQSIDEILLNDNIQNEILEEFEEIPNSEIADTIEINERGSKKIKYFKTSRNKRISFIILKVLEETLKKYWSVSFDASLFASLLDLRSKKLTCFSITERQKQPLCL